MVQTSGNERLTAFVSTMVAVAILAAGVTAHQNAEFKITDVVQVASDLRFQLEMALRHDVRERDARIAQLDEVIQRWQSSPQSEADRQLLLTWLREAGARSLHGVMQPLPAMPEFSTAVGAADVAPPAEHQVRKVPSPEASPRPNAKQPAPPAKGSAEPAPAAPTLGTLYARGQANEPTPVTPTPADPRDEDAITLRQPSSYVPSSPLPGSRTSRSLAPAGPESAPAPRPGARQPVEPNLLASLPVPSDRVATEPVRVNLTELAARIAGYHDSLDEVELVLLRMDTPDLEVVTEQIKKLDHMTRNYGFVQLYYDSLTQAERDSIREPRSMHATLREVKRQLKRCEEVLDGDYLGTFDADAEKEFAALRAQIAEIERRTER